MAGAAEEIVAWTVSVGLDGLDQGELMAGYCERLVEAGVPLWRASIGADTLHPLIVAQGHRWLAGEGVREEFYRRARNPEGEKEWRESPWFWLIESGEGQMRRRLARRRRHQRVPAPRRARCPGRHRLLGADRRRSASGGQPRRGARPGLVLDDPRAGAASPSAISP